MAKAGKTEWTLEEAMTDWKHDRRLLRRVGVRVTFMQWCERLASYGYTVIFPGSEP